MNLQEKNVRTEVLDGKVGRIYMPPQNVDSMALHKSKVSKEHFDCEMRSSFMSCSF